ncbi:MAG: type I 3-dehydroquinate dehydratase [Deltaproteobacteria bacterium]|nr:type I 3-dehydroquinate dehydratase [Deltaproteobacteria bacterium]
MAEITPEGARRAIQEASRLADLIELRLDHMRPPRLEALLERGKKPFIATNRRPEEGGKYQGEERERLAVLRRAAEMGVDFLDVEVGSDRALLSDLMARRGRAGLILSFHDFRGTPSGEELFRLCRLMMRRQAEVVKIVTLARSPADNLRTLALIPYAREKGQEIVAFCMGKKGRMSRIFAPLIGASWTYAALDGRRATAPGQLTVAELREAWRRW